MPFLNYLPRALAPWKVEADRIFDQTLALFSHHTGKVKKDMQEGKDPHCFTKYILQSQKEYNLSDPEATFLAGAMYGGKLTRLLRSNLSHFAVQLDQTQ